MEGKVSEQHPTILSQYGSHRGGVYGVRFRPNMKHLVSGGGDNAVYLWSMHCRPNLRHPVVRPYRYLGHKGPVYAVAVCPLDTLVASGSKDKSIRLWIPTVEGKSTVIKGHTGPVRTLDFSHNGQWILSGSDDKTIKIWQVSNHRFICALSGHMNWVRSAEFSENGRQVVSGSDDRTVRLWDIESHQVIIQFRDVLGEVMSTRFHPDNACIASGSSHNCIQMWDIRSKSLIQHYAANAGAVHSVCFHPSGNYLLSSCQDSTLKIWDLREGQMLYTLQGHDAGTRSAEFSPTGEFFASGSADEHVVLWRTNVDLNGGQPADLRGIVRKDEVGHSLCSACNCLCTSANDQLSIHGCQLDVVNSGSRSPSSPRRMPSPPTPLKKQNPDATEESEAELNQVKLAEKNSDNDMFTVNIHKHSAKIEVPKSPNEKCHLQAADVAEEISNRCSDFCGEPRPQCSTDAKTSNHPAPVKPANLQDVGRTLQRICHQLGVLTQTIALFEERLSHSEKKVHRLERRSNRDKSSTPDGTTTSEETTTVDCDQCRSDLHR